MQASGESRERVSRHVHEGYTLAMKVFRLCMAGLGCLISLTATAQWQWRDRDGRQVFSDQAPPHSIPEKNILRRPAIVPPRRDSSEAVGLPNGAASSTLSANPPAGATSSSGIDNELAQKVRKTEEADKAARVADEQKVSKTRADNCLLARQGKATFDSGVRVVRMTTQGEREIMDGKARATEITRLQSMIDSDCS